MDVKGWLADNAKARRNKYAFLLGLVLFPCVLLVGLYQLYRNIDTLETNSHRNVIVLSSQQVRVVDAYHAQAAFSRQLQEWKDVLLRASDRDDFKTYWNEFLREEESVRTALDKMRVDAQSEHDAGKADTLKAALDLHVELGKLYREAIENYSPTGKGANVFQVENMLLGKDRKLAWILEEFADGVELEYKNLAARIVATQSGEIETMQGRVELNLIIITTLILVEALLILRTISKSTSELNRLADESEKTVYHLAYSDPLTELPNRRLFQDRLEHAIQLSKRSNQFRALMFLDMDNFKTLNDTKGHGMGDLLLMQVARRINSCVRSSDTVARLGGDEFVVLLGELSESEDSASEQVLKIAEKISKSLSQPYNLDQFIYNCSASIGVAMFRDAGMTIEELHKRADAAMYQAKNAGRNTVRFYDPKTQAALEARSELEHALRMAIDNDQLHVYFQVQVDQQSRPVGAEALLRWRHPEMGMVFPGQFIPWLKRRA